MFYELLAVNDPDWKKKIQSRNPVVPTPGIKVGPDGKFSTDLPLPAGPRRPPAPAPAPLTPSRFYVGQIVQSKMNSSVHYKILWFSRDGSEAAVVPEVGPYYSYAFWDLNFLEHVK